MAKYRVGETKDYFEGTMTKAAYWVVKENPDNSSTIVSQKYYDKDVAEDLCAALNFGAELRKDMELKKEQIGLKNNDHRLDKFVPVFCSKCGHQSVLGELFEINLQTNEKLCPKCWGYKPGPFALPKEAGEALGQWAADCKQGKYTYLCGKHGTPDCKECVKPQPEPPRGGFF